jgi:hypothetical protein
MSALITLNKQISNGRPASNRPHPMDLCVQFVKTLSKNIDSTSFVHTPNMSAFPCELTTYLSMSGVEKLIKNNVSVISSESSLTKYFKQLDELVVEDFIKHSSRPHYELAFLNFFTSFSSNNPTRRYTHL